MHIAFVVDNIPNKKHGGGALTAWSMIKSLLAEGHRVTTCCVVNNSQNYNDNLKDLETLGTKVIMVEVKASNLSARMQTTLKSLKPDVISGYHFGAVAATHKIKIAPRMIFVGDPAHLPSFYRWQRTPIRITKEYFSITKSMLNNMLFIKRRMLNLLKDCDRVGAFAGHHAAWFRSKGINCDYFQTPVEDMTNGNRSHGQRKDKFRILLIGHFRGTATLSGIYLFAREVLPILEKQLGPDNFEVRIVGKYEPPADLKPLLAKSFVKLLGFVPSIDEEFLSTDVLAVPIPIKLGIRVRILTGFSFGTCVVSHQSNILGIPEMIHNKNALLAEDGEGLAEMILQVYADHKLKQSLGKNARQTYEDKFSLKTAGKRIVKALERIGERKV